MSFIKKEAQHIEGFAPELAVVTHGGGQKLAEELVVRPTSETIIYDMYRKWINSYRDLPMLINQWGNAVRWELRTRPFLRGMEFLWQEGHTAHASAAEADEEARLILDIYVRLIETELAIPVHYGRKTEREKFAGAAITYTLESLMSDGKALQMGTSHNLGQNFGKAFDVRFQDRDGEERFPWSTSWAVSTRLIGALVLVHGDEKGLQLPPRIAAVQAVIVPIWRNDEERTTVESAVARVEGELSAAGIRLETDRRDTVTPGFKFNHWELRGVPVRIEVGPRDVAAAQVVAVRRDTRDKKTVPMADLSPTVHDLLASVQDSLFKRAADFRQRNTHEVDTLAALAAGLESNPGFYWVSWCGSDACEDAFVEVKGSIRAIPLEEADREPTGPCASCGRPAESKVLVAKSY
jgi:prolyl-tRNA synthetase